MLVVGFGQCKVVKVDIYLQTQPLRLQLVLHLQTLQKTAYIFQTVQGITTIHHQGTNARTNIKLCLLEVAPVESRDVFIRLRAAIRNIESKHPHARSKRTGIIIIRKLMYYIIIGTRLRFTGIASVAPRDWPQG
jgi:hypothetical protein